MNGFTRFRTSLRAVYLLTALLLFAQATVAIHDGSHASLQHDQCAVAQLSQSCSSVLPSKVPTLVIPPSSPSLNTYDLLLSMAPRLRLSLIRAPPFALL